MAISVDLIKELRHMTSASVAHCKKALEDTGGDLKKAAEFLRKHGLEIAAKKQARAAKEGRVEAYVHLGNKIGVLLEVNCESDFVARNPDFCQFTKDLCMHIAACNPSYLKKEDVPGEIIDQEKNKDEYYKAHCLMEQPFVKDPAITINDYLGTIVSKLGENIFVRRFMRYKIGE
ncbi:MAG: translation elongation factor Ts [Candidatus Omnitrophica bacterium]|nr:translation elongation factor Ts [Candidatus Omnitrophota bacterium]MBU1868863.1 translation elongation factor Ts [Candidatus Omnitrophota bacterium]